MLWQAKISTTGLSSSRSHTFLAGYLSSCRIGLLLVLESNLLLSFLFLLLLWGLVVKTDQLPKDLKIINDADLERLYFAALSA